MANLHSYCGGRVEAGGGPGYLASPGYSTILQFLLNFTIPATHPTPGIPNSTLGVASVSGALWQTRYDIRLPFDLI